jgi:chromate reductase
MTSPEYNKGISDVLKNALDWISRVPGGVWKDKPVVVMSAAAGRSGGETAQYMVRHCFMPFGARLVAGPLVCIASANEQFDETNRLLSARYQSLVAKVMDNLRREIEMQKKHPSQP